MKRTLMVLAILLVTSAGCITPQASDLGAAPATKAPLPQRPPAVYAESITDDNAHQKALALEAEMDFDVQSAATPAH